jgi:hypothetical protein
MRIASLFIPQNPKTPKPQNPLVIRAYPSIN